jgi:hypothetical protein
MKTRTNLTAMAALVSTVAIALGACAGEASPNASRASSDPTVVAIYYDVHWYPPCATSPIKLGGQLFYPWPMGAPPIDESKYPVPETLASLPEGASGGAGRLDASLRRVVPPGPGDDVGTVVEYSDGMARFESRNGNVAWLTLEPQEYGYVC